MSAPETDHPFDVQTLAAFVDGRLDSATRMRVVAHVTRCALCRRISGRSAATDEIQRPPDVGAPWRMRLIAAAAAVVIVGGGIMVERSRREEPISSMAAAAPRMSRTIEPRLTGGFRWAPFHNPMASAQARSGEELVARGTAGRMLRRLEDDDTAGGLHAKAVAYLLRDNSPAATALLRKATTLDPQNAKVWSDLAAALYVNARSENDLRDALAAARRAINLDPSLAEARFNLALILERIGTPGEIRAAWTDYLGHDNKSAWAAEAKSRLAASRDAA